MTVSSFQRLSQSFLSNKQEKKENQIESSVMARNVLFIGFTSTLRRECQIEISVTNALACLLCIHDT